MHYITNAIRNKINHLKKYFYPTYNRLNADTPTAFITIELPPVAPASIVDSPVNFEKHATMHVPSAELQAITADGVPIPAVIVPATKPAAI